MCLYTIIFQATDCITRPRCSVQTASLQCPVWRLPTAAIRWSVVTLGLFLPLFIQDTHTTIHATLHTRYTHNYSCHSSYKRHTNLILALFIQDTHIHSGHSLYKKHTQLFLPLFLQDTLIIIHATLHKRSTHNYS